MAKIGIFEFNPETQSWDTNEIHIFKDADIDFVIPENQAQRIGIARDNVEYVQSLYQQAGEQAGRIIANDAIQAGVFQNSRPNNLATKGFDFVGIKGNIQTYSGVVCMDPKWTPANTNDRITGEEFTFECINVTQKGGYYEYSGYAGIKPPYEQFRDNWPLVTFRTNVDLKALTSQGVPDILMGDGVPHSSYTNYPPNREGAKAVTKLFSQQEIYYGTQNQLFLGELQKLPNGKVEAILNLSRINEDPQY